MTGTALRHHLPATDAVCWCRGCAGTAARASSIQRRRGPASRRRSARMCVTSWMRLASSERCLSVTTGAVAVPACARHCGPSACAAWCRSTATTSRTYPRQADRERRRRNIGTGISGISTPNAAAPGCKQNRRDIARLLWRLWSPNWQFDDATFEATASSFDNPDFVDVTIQSYRHRYGNAPGDPALEPLEQRLAERPPITVPTIVLHGACDGVGPPEQSENHARHFTGRYERRVVPVAGHFLSRETPDAVVQAVRDLLA